MYEVFYGLNADPFRLSVEPRFCFPHRSYARAKAYVEYALHRAEGFVMITGSPGTGKTTLVNDLLEHLPRRQVVTATLVSTQLEADDLLRMTAHGFGLESQQPRKSQVLQRLMEFLAQLHQQGMRTLLIIDEAQDLAPAALEELRLLTNLQREGQPLLQIVLLGQEPLADLLHRPELEQVHQRLIAAWQLQPLDLAETIDYVRYRLEQSGWRGDPAFEPGVLSQVHAFSAGIPRRINLICSRLLLHGAISERHTLTADDAATLIDELRQERLGGYARGAAGEFLEALVPSGAARPAPPPSPPPDENPETVDHGLKGPVAPPNPPTAAPPAGATAEDGPAPKPGSAPQDPEPPADGAPEPAARADYKAPTMAREPDDGAPRRGAEIPAAADASPPATPKRHGPYRRVGPRGAPAGDRAAQPVPRRTRRIGWIKALLLLGALLLVALALASPAWQASVLEMLDPLRERFE